MMAISVRTLENHGSEFPLIRCSTRLRQCSHQHNVCRNGCLPVLSTRRREPSRRGASDVQLVSARRNGHLLLFRPQLHPAREPDLFRRREHNHHILRCRLRQRNGGATQRRGRYHNRLSHTDDNLVHNASTLFLPVSGCGDGFLISSVNI